MFPSTLKSRQRALSTTSARYCVIAKCPSRASASCGLAFWGPASRDRAFRSNQQAGCRRPRARIQPCASTRRPLPQRIAGGTTVQPLRWASDAACGCSCPSAARSNGHPFRQTTQGTSTWRARRLGRLPQAECPRPPSTAKPPWPRWPVHPRSATAQTTPKCCSTPVLLRLKRCKGKRRAAAGWASLEAMRN